MVNYLTVHPVHNIFEPGECRVDTGLKPLGEYGMSSSKGGGGGVVVRVTYLKSRPYINNC